jgi:hypothetical protein
VQETPGKSVESGNFSGATDAFNKLPFNDNASGSNRVEIHPLASLPWPVSSGVSVMRQL